MCPVCTLVKTALATVTLCIARFLQAEIATLRADVERLTSELKTSEQKRLSVTDQLSQLNQQLATLRQSTDTTPSDGLGKPSPTDSEVEVRRPISLSNHKSVFVDVDLGYVDE